MAVPRHLDFTAGGWAVNEIPQAIPPSQPFVTRCRTGAYASRGSRGRRQARYNPNRHRRLAHGSHRNRFSRTDAAAKRTGPAEKADTNQPRTFNLFSTFSDVSSERTSTATRQAAFRRRRRRTDSQPAETSTPSPMVRSQDHLAARHESSVNSKPRGAPSQDTSLERITATCGATGDALSNTPIIVSSFTSIAA
jgi:hypothetical protein